jgi:GT2 family glycosyltransferase
MSSVTARTDLSIVVPVFNALEETLDCIASLLKSDAQDCDIYLMDDGSDWSVHDTLRETFRESPNVKLISHFRNRGYTRNISMGVEQTSTPFVCILNSDTLLPAVWAGPMLEKMTSDGQLAGIGPLSNAASYQSIPDVIDAEQGGFSENGGLGFEPSDRKVVADLVGCLGQGKCVDVPILNGFCTIFRRSAIEAIGGFDVDGYPQGYGEENDLCVRLKAEGYRLAVFLGVFIHHQKSKSFGSDRKKKLSAEGARTLAQKFGASLVPGLEVQLKASTSLEMMRRLVGIALSSGQGLVRAPQTLTVESEGVTVGPRAQKRCITLTGGARYAISTDAITSQGAYGDASLGVSASPDGVNVSLPEGTTLALFSTSPIASTLYALSLGSIDQTVYVDDWKIGGQIRDVDGETFVDWPEDWDMGVAYEVPFEQVWIDI